jgi:hypothetical protein
MAGTLTVGGSVNGLLSGQKTIGPVTMTGTALVGQITDLTLQAGANVFTVPTGAAAVMIALSPTNSQTVKVCTSLDTAPGVSVGPTGFVVFPIPSGASSVTLTVAGAGPSVELSFI